MERGLTLEPSSLMEDALELRMASLAASFADLYACLAAPFFCDDIDAPCTIRQRFLATIASLESWLLGCWPTRTDRFLPGACLSRRISSFLLNGQINNIINNKVIYN